MGNIATDIELRTTPNGIACATFRIACQRRYKNDQGAYEADFISCVAWRQTAEFIKKYFLKGNKIGLIGSIQTRNYTAQDGSKRYVTEVLVDNAEFVSARGDNSGAGTPQPQPTQQTTATAQQGYNQQVSLGEVPNQDDDDELPF